MNRLLLLLLKFDITVVAVCFPGDDLSTFPCLKVTFIVSRNLGYYMIQYYIPSTLLVILSWVGFWISVDAVVARVSIGLLTVLNLTMQSTGSRNQLPQVSYIKAIDVWMSVSLAFAFGSLLEFAIVNVWSRKEVKGKGSASFNPRSAAPVPAAPAATPAPSAAVTQTSGRRKSTFRKEASIEEIQAEETQPPEQVVQGHFSVYQFMVHNDFM